MNKTLPISEAREHLRDLVDQARRTMTRAIITRNGKPEAVLMGYPEYESWIETLDTLADSEEVAAIREGEADIRAGNVVSFEEAFGEPLREPSSRPPSVQLTDREAAVMQLIAVGKSVKEAAVTMHISAPDVKQLMASIVEKLNLRKSALAESVKILEENVLAQKRKPVKAGR